MSLSLDSPVQYIPRVGPAMAEKLAKLGLITVSDLLYYPPFRYIDYSLVTPVSRVQPGETVTIKATLISLENVVTKNGKRLQVGKIQDDSGTLEVIWFNQQYLIYTLKTGTELSLAGKVDWFGRKIALFTPAFEIITDTEKELLHTGRLVPVYSETEGVTSKFLRSRVSYLLTEHLEDSLDDPLPEEIRKQYSLPSIQESIRLLHFPDTLDHARQAKKRLAFEELLILQLRSLVERRQREMAEKAISIQPSQNILADFKKTLPFTLTEDQIQAISDIITDIAKPYPMNRLLEGDVGSGKTVVAAIAMASCYAQGYSSVLMAPTQILADQHYRTISDLMAPYRIPVNLVTGSEKITNGPLFSNRSVTIGTHALLSSGVAFDHVALIVIDEQQRFGVGQRQLLREKAGGGEVTPHLLSMTATPIPRTIALTIFRSLDVSVIREMPKGRLTVKTWVVPSDKRIGAYEWIRKQIQTHHSQTFIICPLINESDAMDEVKAAKSEYERLGKTVFKSEKLLLLHGKMKAIEKTKTLDSFHDGKADILVTTPVVEVGIDIPHADIIMIEAADRFGLSQLHQLRGRVGRRNQASYCLLFTENDDEKSLARLKAMENVHSGPELAEIDLALRGPGELFGTKQHGLPHLIFGNLLDTVLVEETRVASDFLFQTDPTLTVFPLLRAKAHQGTITTSD